MLNNDSISKLEVYSSFFIVNFIKHGYNMVSIGEKSYG